MEREQELRKLINVLHRTARAAVRVQWMNAGETEARFAVAQYNRILARLTEIDANVKGVFEPLAEDSSLTVVAMACRQLVSYYEDELGGDERRDWDYSAGDWRKAPPPFPFAGAAFGKDFDMEDLGNWIRDRIHEWKRGERERRGGRRHCG
jgi:hypothetical protein